MQTSPHTEESDRIEALRRYQILDTLPEQDFEDLTCLAANICRTPIALISLVDSERLWFKSKLGLELPEVSRARSFCSHAITHPGLLVVNDALTDLRFADCPLVTAEPFFRFYAGSPLVTSTGHVLGTICVIDRVPRKLSPEQGKALAAIGNQVMTQLELRRHAATLTRTVAELERAETATANARAYAESIVETVREPLVVLDRQLQVNTANRAFYRKFQMTPEATEGRLIYELGDGNWNVPRLREVLTGVIERDNFFRDFEIDHEFPVIGRRTMLLDARRLRPGGSHEAMLLLSFEDITRRKWAEQRLVSQYAVSRVLVEATTVAEAAPRILQAVCENLGWVLGAFWRVDQAAGVLRCLAFWHGPESGLADFADLNRQAEYVPNMGFPGHVWANGRAVWVSDVSKDLRFSQPLTDAGRELRAAAGFPIFLDDEVFGVMEFFSPETREPVKNLPSLMSTIAVQIGQLALRERIEAALEKARDELEVRVEERTSALALANEILKREAAERGRAEEALYRREREFAALVENAPDVISRFDQKLNFTYLSPAVEGITGLPARAFIGKNYREMGMGPEDCARLDESLRRVFATGQKEYVELNFISPVGIRYYDTIAVPEFARDGSVESVITVSRDITERKRAETDLRASEERFMKAFNASPYPMIISEFKDGRYLDVNDSFLNATGYTREEVMGYNTLEMDLWADRDDSPRLIAKLLSKGNIQKEEVKFRVKSGEMRIGLFSAERIEVGGEQCILSLITDITERKAAEDARAQLLQRLVTTQEEERRRLSRELHDNMGQHLSALILGLSSLKNACQDQPLLVERVQWSLALTDRIAQEVHQLAWKLRPAALDGACLRDAIANYLATWSQRTGITTDFHSVDVGEERYPAHVETTTYRIVQEALTNVLKHAAAQRVSLIVERRRDYMFVVVEDDGRGFDAQAEPGGAGTGKRLGLLGMQERVALVEGTLDIESSPGAGTTIFVRIPMPPPEQSGANS